MIDEEKFMQICSLRDEGKLQEAAEGFEKLADDTADPLDRAGILLNAASTNRALRSYDLAKQQLKEARVSIPPTSTLPFIEDSQARPLSLLLGIETEEAYICWVEGKREEALAKLNRLVERHGEALRDPVFREGYHYMQLLRAYLLTDLGNWREALPILVDAESYDGPQAAELVNYYLGHCYACTCEHVKAKPRLIEALKLGLPPHLEHSAHYDLGIVYFHLEHYARAKIEFEIAAKFKDSPYIENGKIWRWLEATCRHLGSIDEAERYAKLERPGKCATPAC
jgi:tetratricopeptide (TPR) repeat protein